MKINIPQLKKWIVALDSGKFKQGKKKLQLSDTYCCLGVGCKLFIKKDKLLFDKHGDIAGDFPVKQPSAPIWLKLINNDFSNLTGMGLSTLNDEEGFTFTEIATMLELVYIHKILN